MSINNVRKIKLFFSKTLITLHLARPRFQEEVKDNSSTSTVKPRFMPTKWQSIDPTQVAAQGKIHDKNKDYLKTKKNFPFLLAVTISKWDFDQESTVKGNESLYEDLTETRSTSTENNHINTE